MLPYNERAVCEVTRNIHMLTTPLKPTDNYDFANPYHAWEYSIQTLAGADKKKHKTKETLAGADKKKTQDQRALKLILTLCHMLNCLLLVTILKLALT